MTRRVKLRLADEAPALLEGMIRQAKLGDTAALAWCLDRGLDLPASGRAAP